jgi:hypothetical protein
MYKSSSDSVNVRLAWYMSLHLTAVTLTYMLPASLFWQNTPFVMEHAPYEEDAGIGLVFQTGALRLALS